MRAIVLCAHPDDAEFTCAGTVALWTSQGHDIRYVVCTDGEKGSHNPTIRPAELAGTRRAEQRSAAMTLGVKEVLFLGYSDGELATTQDLKAALTRLIRHLRPDRLLTWDPWRRYQLHPDHRACGLAALDAVLAAGNPHYFPMQRAEGLQAHRTEEVWLFGTDQPDEWVDITETFHRKMEAIRSHHSQVDQRWEVVEQMSRCNRDFGAACGCAYAEAFKVLRPFCEA